MTSTRRIDKSLFDPFGFKSDQFTKSGIGFENYIKQLVKIAETNAPTYPPYNIRQVDENRYVIEIAVAGFGSQDIEIELADDTLSIKGQLNASNYPPSEFIFKGIADRAFTRRFTLADNVVIDNAQLLNGMLKIWLDKIIPESKKPKKIKIDDPSSSADKEPTSKQFLSEKI